MNTHTQPSKQFPTFGRYGDENDVVQVSRRAYVKLTTLTMHVRLCPVDTGQMHGPDEPEAMYIRVLDGNGGGSCRQYPWPEVSIERAMELAEMNFAATCTPWTRMEVRAEVSLYSRPIATRINR